MTRFSLQCRSFRRRALKEKCYSRCQAEVSPKIYGVHAEWC